MSRQKYLFEIFCLGFTVTLFTVVQLSSFSIRPAFFILKSNTTKGEVTSFHENQTVTKKHGACKVNCMEFQEKWQK